MVTEAMMQAIEILLTLCQNNEMKNGVLCTRNLLGDFDEDEFLSMTDEEKAEWVKQFVCKPTETDADDGRKWPTLTKEDVWGDYEKGTKGMIVARSGDICPVFHDKVPYKSVTVICDESQMSEVEYWLAYVHGGNCVRAEKQEPNGKVAIRSDYQCW